jgi:ABC-2 type transport system ATP-binding protein
VTFGSIVRSLKLLLVVFFGEPFHTNRTGVLKKIGSLIESPSLYGHLTARENLEVYRTVYGATKEKVDEVLETVGLRDVGKKTAKKFSLGMKQRLSIALALLPTPELLILDEPANGLDPAGIIELRHLIRKLNREQGMTVIISSHLLGEVEKIVSHVGIIAKGKMLFQGALSELEVLQQKGSRIFINTSDNAAALQVLQDMRPAKEQETISVAFDDVAQVASINRRLSQSGLDVYLLHPKKTDLEQLFIELTSN